MCVVRVEHTPLCLCAAGSESVSQSFYEAMNVGEGVVERHRSDPQHAGLPHVTLNKDKHQKLLMQITPRFKLMLWIFPVQKQSSKIVSVLTATPLFSISWKTVLMGTEKQSDSWQPLCCGSEGVMMRT